jgi:hypothetical protein
MPDKLESTENNIHKESTENILHNKSINPIKPIIYSSSDAKTVVDYGTHVVLLTGEKNKLSAILYTTKTNLELECYTPLTPFLNKYRALYYKPDCITEDLITVFFDW